MSPGSVTVLADENGVIQIDRDFAALPLKILGPWPADCTIYMSRRKGPGVSEGLTQCESSEGTEGSPSDSTGK